MILKSQYTFILGLFLYSQTNKRTPTPNVFTKKQLYNFKGMQSFD